MSLSDKIVKSYCDDVGNWTTDNIELDDVKEFILRLKEKENEGKGESHIDIYDILVQYGNSDISTKTAEFLIRAAFTDRIDKLAGEDLI